MSSRVGWTETHDAIKESGPADPFAGPIAEVGVRVDLTNTDELEYRLVDTLRQEGALEEEGITCRVKAKADTSCHACPIAEAHLQTPLSVLCRIGRTQELLCTQLAVNALEHDD